MSLIVVEFVLFSHISVLDNIASKTSLLPIKMDLCTSKRVSFSPFAVTNNYNFVTPYRLENL